MEDKVVPYTLAETGLAASDSLDEKMYYTLERIHSQAAKTEAGVSDLKHGIDLLTSTWNLAAPAEGPQTFIKPDSSELLVTCVIDEPSVPIHQSSTFSIFKGTMDTKKGKVTVAIRRQFRAYRLPEGQPYFHHFNRHVDLWSSLVHPNVLQIFGWQIVDGMMQMVMPYCEKGDIMAYIKANPTANRYNLAVEIARGLDYLHKQKPPIIHSGLKPQSILVDDNGKAMITEFEFARRLSNVEQSYFVQMEMDGNVDYCRWWSPERIQNQLWNDRIDVWSWAMTILTIVTGKKPYSRSKGGIVLLAMFGMDEDIFMQKDMPTQTEYPSEYWQEYPTLWEAILRCLKWKPANRPSMREILSSLDAYPPSV